jgi:cell division protein FtsZ
MNQPFELQQENHATPDIRIIGVGGAGISMCRKLKNQLPSLTVIAVDSSERTLSHASELTTVNIGNEQTNRLGGGGNYELGKSAATDAKEAIKQQLLGADLIVIVAGLSGAIGSGATPVIAQIAKDHQIPAIAFTSTPFPFEGTKRQRIAKHTNEVLEPLVESLFVLSNSKLLDHFDKNTLFTDAMDVSANLLVKLIEQLLDICLNSALINIDFADLLTLLSQGGLSYIGQSDTVALTELEQAMDDALSNPVLVSSGWHNARGVLVYVETSEDFDMAAWAKIGEQAVEIAGENAEIIVGIKQHKEWCQQVRVTFLVTGLGQTDK